MKDLKQKSIREVVLADLRDTKERANKLAMLNEVVDRIEIIKFRLNDGVSWKLCLEYLADNNDPDELGSTCKHHEHQHIYNAATRAALTTYTRCLEEWVDRELESLGLV